MTGPHDTGACPVGHRCESCGRETDGLAVEVVELGGLGLACLTLCLCCAASAEDVPISVATARRLVEQHRVHLERGTGGTAG